MTTSLVPPLSCGPRVDVVLKATAARRPDLLDHDGQPTDAIWAAFGAEMAAGNLAVMEDPQESIEALHGFLEFTVAAALDGLTLDSLYELSGEPPEAPSWIGRSAARLQAASREEPYPVRLAQVPASTSDALYDQILHDIQTVTRSEEITPTTGGTHLRLLCRRGLRADPRGLDRVLAAVLPHASNPQLARAIGTRLANLDAAVSHPTDRAGEIGRSGVRPVTS